MLGRQRDGGVQDAATAWDGIERISEVTDMLSRQRDERLQDAAASWDTISASWDAISVL